MKRHILTKTIILAGTVTAAAITYEEWKSSVFTPMQQAEPAVSGEAADPDADGIKNLAEFAFGTEPLIPDATSPTYSAFDLDGHLHLSYPRQKSFSGILYAPQVTSDPRYGWQSGPQHLLQLGIIDTNPAFDLVQVRDTRYSPRSPKRFARVLVATDSDNDSLPDDWEMAAFGSLTAQSGTGDFDLDVLSNLLEWQMGTDPTLDYYNGNRPPGIPSAPTDVIVFDNGDGTVSAYWTDTSNNETAFILRRVDGDGVSRVIGTAPTNEKEMIAPDGR